MMADILIEDSIPSTKRIHELIAKEANEWNLFYRESYPLRNRSPLKRGKKLIIISLEDQLVRSHSDKKTQVRSGDIVETKNRREITSYLS
jgi:hypothetical protein